MITKQQIIDRAKRQLNEIHQYFNDVEHWNRVHVDEDRIDADPHGTVDQMAHALELFITRHSPVIDI